MKARQRALRKLSNQCRAFARQGGASSSSASSHWHASSSSGSAIPLPSKTFYVYANASGNGDGGSWENAFQDLPRTLQRDALYYVGAGAYSSHRFNDPGSELILIKKATESEHGTALGWKSSIADGQAVFGNISFEGNNYVIEGVFPYGFKFLGAFRGTVLEVNDAAHNITVRNSDLDGNFRRENGYQTGGACNVANLLGQGITLEYCDVHNAADDGIGVYGTDITVKYSRVHRLHGCGTDGGCGPCYNGHSDGFELQQTKNVTLVGNLVYDIESTSALITGQWSPGNYTENLQMFNNIFYTPRTGITVYLYYVKHARIFNNVIWGMTQGSRYGGLAIGKEVTDMELANNIILNINYNHLGGVYNPAEHRMDYNMFGMIASSEYRANTHDIVQNPKFRDIVISSNPADHPRDIEPENFSLLPGSPAIDAGTAQGAYVTDDITGTARPQDGDGLARAEFDIGAFEMRP